MTTVTGTTRYGTAAAAPGDGCTSSWHRRAGWENHHGELPVIEGTLIRLRVDHLPGDRSPEPIWLWSSRTGASASRRYRTVAGIPAAL